MYSHIYTTHTRTHTRTRTHTHVYIHVHIHTYTYTYTHNIYVHVHVHTQHIHVHIQHIHTHVHTHTYLLWPLTKAFHALVPNGSTWMPVPDLAGPITNHLYNNWTHIHHIHERLVYCAVFVYGAYDTLYIHNK